jgi:hypothetical protein
MWIADLVACGLIRASFVPEEEIQALRSVLRARKQLTREQTSHVQRLQKTLEEANVKLDSVITDIVGLTGRSFGRSKRLLILRWGPYEQILVAAVIDRDGIF